MKAIVQDVYGSPDVMRLEEVALPPIGADGVLVRVRAAAVNPLDWHFMRGEPYLLRLISGLRKPKRRIQGVDVAGEVEAVGADVRQFKQGDAVYGAAPGGAFAEYVAGKEHNFVPKPEGLTFEQAAAIPIVGLTALQALRDKAQVRAGQHVLFNGAGGGVGTFAVQIARAFGAEVTGVCSTRNLELVTSLGADHVIDYTREDFTKMDRRYDVVLDAAGNHSLSELRRALKPDGVLVMVGGGTGRWIEPIVGVLRAILTSLISRQRVIVFIAKERQSDLLTLTDLVQAGKLEPVVDRTYPLGDTPEAIRLIETGHARGKIVVVP